MGFCRSVSICAPTPLLDASLREYGAGRAVLTDRDGVLIAGNKTFEVAQRLGIPTRVIETDGQELVVVRRRDLRLASDPQARALAIADNRVGELDLAWDPAILQQLKADGLDLGLFWTTEEFERLLGEGTHAGQTDENAVVAPGALLHEDPAGGGAVWPALLVTLRRSHTTGMKSKVHPTYKTKYRVANWPAYNRALVRRGDVTVWVSSEANTAWTPRRSGQRGGQRRYSDLAIETALTLRLLYHLPLRQAEGFLHALFGMMRLDLSAPDDTTLSRRSQHLRRRLRSPVPPGEGLHLVLDSTGLSLVGAGEWATATHGGRGRRGWRKLHRGVDQSGAILVHTLTEATGDDATTALDLLIAVEGPLVRITADAASDTVAVYQPATARGATVVIPPARTANVSGHGPRSPARDRTITVVKQLGRRRWKKRRQGTIVRAEWRTRSSDTRPSSAMAFAPGVQLDRGVRSSSAVRSSIG